MSESTPLQRALFFLRVSVFIVMLMWALDKVINPEHAGRVLSNFYGIQAHGHLIPSVMGGLQLIFLLGFVTGFKKKWTYGGVLIMHGLSTFSSWAIYLSPWEKNHLLFFAAWPMLAAAYSLFVLRDEDTLFSV